MAIPPVFSVRKGKFRIAAMLLTVGWLLVVGFYILYQLGMVYLTRNSPPTVSTLHDGTHLVNGLAQWGTLPNFWIVNHGQSNIKLAYLDGEWGQGWDSNFDVSEGSQPSIQLKNNAVFINSSMLVPKFGVTGQWSGINYKHPPFLQLSLMFDGTDHDFGIGHGPADMPKDALWSAGSSEWLTFDQEVRFPQGDEAGHFTIQNLNIGKRKVPAEGVFWGFPGEGDHVKNVFTVSYGPMETDFFWDDQGYWHKNRVMLWLTVADAGISVVAPVSVLAQVATILGSFGGFVTLLGTLFAILFVRRFPLSDQELESAELTLRGFSSKARLDIDQWKQDESLDSPLIRC